MAVVKHTVKQLLSQLGKGLISHNEFNATLDILGIRGAVRNNGGYIGYDYTNQEWIDIDGIKGKMF